MKTIKYPYELKKEHIDNYVSLLKNKTYKLLPLKEEGLSWDKHLETVIVELYGFGVIVNHPPQIISIYSKLESLRDQSNFSIYRKTIFEILSELDKIA